MAETTRNGLSSAIMGYGSYVALVFNFESKHTQSHSQVFSVSIFFIIRSVWELQELVSSPDPTQLTQGVSQV